MHFIHFESIFFSFFVAYVQQLFNKTSLRQPIIVLNYSTRYRSNIKMWKTRSLNYYARRPSFLHFHFGKLHRKCASLAWVWTIIHFLSMPPEPEHHIIIHFYILNLSPWTFATPFHFQFPFCLFATVKTEVLLRSPTMRTTFVSTGSASCVYVPEM